MFYNYNEFMLLLMFACTTVPQSIQVRVCVCGRVEKYSNYVLHSASNIPVCMLTSSIRGYGVHVFLCRRKYMKILRKTVLISYIIMLPDITKYFKYGQKQ